MRLFPYKNNIKNQHLRMADVKSRSPFFIQNKKIIFKKIHRIETRVFFGFGNIN